MRALPVFVALVVLASGCVAPEPDATEPVQEDQPPVGEAWSLALQDCTDASNVAVYAMDSLVMGGPSVPEPWVKKDVTEELDAPRTGSYGEPILGATTGHWHSTIVCDGSAIGWVGIEVEAPAFDVGGAERHILLAALSFADDEVRTTVAELSGFTPARNLGSDIMMVGDGVMYMVNDDEDHGVYEGWGPVLPYRSKDPHTVRWWVTVEDHAAMGPDDEHGAHIPHWFDLSYGPTEQAVSPETVGVGCHTRTEMHGPQGGACAGALLVSYATPELTFAYGGRANATLEDAWHHG